MIRSQMEMFASTDDHRKEWPVTMCPPEEDTARQEFKAECDTKTILRRYGLPPGKPSNGVVDFDMTLQGAIESVKEAEEAYGRLSPEIRSLYPSWQAIAEAVAQGKFTMPAKEEPVVEQKS